MQEYVTQAVVLNKDPWREQDTRYSFFTERFGKVVGKATSARKVTSKLAGHLEPGTLSQVRFVERRGTQIVDALKITKTNTTFTDLRLLNKLLHEGEPDPALWHELAKGTFSWRRILAILGWDPVGSLCESCGKQIGYFYIPRQEFFCAACASKLKRDELVLVDAEV